MKLMMLATPFSLYLLLLSLVLFSLLLILLSTVSSEMAGVPTLPVYGPYSPAMLGL
jgi:hypothetical protein